MGWKSGRSYSTDLRSLVPAGVDGGKPARAVAQVFQVSVSYVHKALARRVATGETEARPQRHHQALKLVARHEAIAGEVARRPDLTLAEPPAWLLATHGVSASLGRMHDTLGRLGLTLKKVGPGTRAGPARGRPAARRPAQPAKRHEPGAAGVRGRLSAAGGQRCGDGHGPALRPQPAWGTP
jgi:transposase